MSAQDFSSVVAKIQVGEHISSQDIPILLTSVTGPEKTHALKAIGDIASDANQRTTIADEKLIEILVTEFCKCSTNDGDTVRLIARALGNMCFDHPTNRDKLMVNTGFIPQLFAFLDLFSNDSTVLRNLCGALANLASETATAQQIACDLGAIKILLHLVKESSNEARIMASRAISNIMDLELSLPHFVNNNGLEYFISTIPSCPELSSDFGEIVNKLLQDTGSRTHIAQSSTLPFLVQLFSQNIRDEDEDTAQELIETLVAASELDELKRKFISQNVVKDLLVMESTLPMKLQVLAFKILANVSLDDETIIDLLEYFPKLLSVCIALQKVQLGNPECDLVVHSLMAIGNIARNDTNSKTLIKHEDMIPTLFHFAHHPDKRIAHLALGALRNLSVPKENKEILAAANIFSKCLIPVLNNPDQRNPHLQYAVIGSIRSLLSEGNQAMVALLGEEGVQSIISLAKGDFTPKQEDNDDEPRDKRVEYEAARILAKLSESELFKTQLLGDDVVKCLLELVQSKYEILQTEGLQAILRLGAAIPNKNLVRDTLESFSSSNPELNKLCADIKNSVL